MRARVGVGDTLLGEELGRIKAAPTASVVIYSSGKGFVTVSKDLGNETRSMDAGKDEDATYTDLRILH